MKERVLKLVFGVCLDDSIMTESKVQNEHRTETKASPRT
jgi:hypothetical protein